MGSKTVAHSATPFFMPQSFTIQSPSWYNQSIFLYPIIPVAPLIDDIQEELRREDLVARFKKGLPWIFAAAVAILLAAAGYTAVKAMQEKNMVHYEALYDEVTEVIRKGVRKEDQGWVKNTLETVSKECSGLRFLALMTLADMEKSRIAHCAQAPVDQKVGNVQNAHRDSRSMATGAMDSSAPAVVTDLKDSLTGTVMTEAENSLTQSPTQNRDSTPSNQSKNLADARKNLAHYDARLLGQFKDSEFRQFLAFCRLLLDAHCDTPYFGPAPLFTGQNINEKAGDASPLPPLGEEECRNMLAMYQNSRAWKPLIPALEIMKMPKDHSQQHALRQWILQCRAAFGPNITIPLHTLMGTVEDIQP
jgi:hypothetical protein